MYIYSHISSMRIVLRQSAPHGILCTGSGLLEKSDVCALINVAWFLASGDWIYGVEINPEA